MSSHDQHGAHHHEIDETPDVSHIANPDTKHETSDVSASMLLKYIGVLLVSTLIIMAAMKVLADFLEAREQSLELPPASRVNPPGTQRLPPAPRLQGAPGSQEMPLVEEKEYRAEQNAKVASYGWVNREAGIVRIPIEQAKKLILERGMPVTSGAAPSPSPQGTPGVVPKPAATGRVATH